MIDNNSNGYVLIFFFFVFIEKQTKKKSLQIIGKEDWECGIKIYGDGEKGGQEKSRKGKMGESWDS